MDRTRLATATVAGVAAAGLLAFGAGSAAATPARHPAHHHPVHGHRHAVFVLANDPSGNTIAVYDRHRDGTLSAAGRYPTAGRGGILAGSVADHLSSQGALT